MLNEDLLLKRFQSRGFKVGQELAIYPKYLHAFLDDSDRADLAIIGIEGINKLHNGLVVPCVEEIVDFSSISADTWESYREKCKQASENMIEKIQSEGKSQGYTFVLFNKDDFLNS
jgi:hypothetical protein